MASMVSPTATEITGCCEPDGNWFSTELTLVAISVCALSGS